MKTPITDRAAKQSEKWPVLSAYKHMYDTAAKLERDRELALEALNDALIALESSPPTWHNTNTVIRMKEVITELKTNEPE